MNRYIVIAAQSHTVSFDEIAESPLVAVASGEVSIGADVTSLERCERGAPKALYSVYRAPSGFREVSADDTLEVEEACEYVGTYGEAFDDRA